MKAVLAIVVGLLAASTSFANSYGWDAAGNCVSYPSYNAYDPYYNPYGVLPSVTADYVCGQDYYSWDNTGMCSVFSGGGRWKYETADYLCGQDYYAWDNYGQCSVFAGNGRWKYVTSSFSCSGY